MKLRGLLIAAVILAGLTGFLYWSEHHKPSEDTTVTASLKAAPKILSIPQGDIVQVKIERKGEEPVVLKKNEAGTWEITAPSVMSADQGAVSSLLSTVSGLDSDRLVEEKETNLGPYGLTSPDLEVEATLKDKQTKKLLIGDKTPAGNAYFAALAGDPRLFTVASYNEESLNKTSGDLRDKRLITADFDKVSQIELEGVHGGKKADITFGREKSGSWQIVKPQPYRADSSQVESLISALRDAKMETGPGTDEKKSAEAFRAGAPVATAKVTGASGTQEIEVRKAKDDYYAKSSVIAGVYKVPASVGTGLGKSVEDFREKKLFAFGFGEPDRIEIHDGEKAYFLTHTDSGWWGADGKKLDEMTVEPLVEKVRDLAATKFVESGFTTAAVAVRITVVSDGKKRTENVELAKGKDGYIGKRDDGAGLYEIPATAMSELEKAAAGVKAEAAGGGKQK